MAYNKVIYGGKTLIDLSSATATADKILSGYTAYGKSGAKLTGTASAAGGTLVVTAPAGVTASVTKGSKTETKTVGTGGTATFQGLEAGTWVVKIVRGSETATKSVIIKTDYAVTLTFSTIPAFTYTGSFQIVDDNDNPITTSTGNWKIRFLTSGTLKFTDLRGAENGIDVFLAGGGGGGAAAGAGGRDATYYRYGSGGGGGGYMKTSKNVSVSTSSSYTITVGAGGAVGKDGGATTAFGSTANGGKGATSANGGNGGSGGSAGTWAVVAGSVGGEDGSNGNVTGNNAKTPGTGIGSTTREFGASGAKLYCAGGASGGGNGNGADNTGTPAHQGAVNSSGGGGYGNPAGPANTGSGGAGGSANGATVEQAGAGGSGIVVIRNKR